MLTVRDEIKKLSPEEKLILIDELLESIDDGIIDEYLSSTREQNILHERIEKYQSGKMQFDSWENVQKRLLEKRQKRSKDGL